MIFKHSALTLLAIMIMGSVPASAACPGEAFLGLKDFTTRVTGAKSGKAIGVNGYYRMRVSMDAACRVRVDLVKLGFNKVMFSKDKLQWGSFGARVYQVPTGEDGGTLDALFVDASLRSNAGSALDMAITLLDNGMFNGSVGAGFWRHLGASWEQSAMWGGLQWANATENGPYAATNKPQCEAVVASANGTTAAAFSCDGFFVASNDLSQALVARPPPMDAPFSYGKIVDRGTFTGGGFWWDVCVFSESDSGPGPKPIWAERVQLIPGRGASTAEPPPASWKRCGAPVPRPEVVPAPRWNGGIR